MLGNIFGGIASLFQPGTQNYATPQAAPTQPRYNPSQGPLSIEAITGQQEKPFQYETPKQQSAASFLDLANQAGKAAQQYAKPAGNFWYNNQQVDEATYRRLTAAPALQTAPPPAAIAKTGAAEVYNRVDALGAKKEAELDALKARITGAANPYGIDTEGYRMGLNGARNRLVGQQNREQALAQGRIGGVASGLREAKSDAMSNDARFSAAQLESQMYAAERDRAAGYESNRDQALMRLNMGDYSGAAGLYGGLMDATIGQYNKDRGYDLDMRQDARAETSASLNNEATRLKIKQYASEANMSEQLFESEVAAKKQQYEAAKQQGREAAWMSENSYWLGPLKAVFNIIPAVAGAVAGR